MPSNSHKSQNALNNLVNTAKSYKNTLAMGISQLVKMVQQGTLDNDAIANKIGILTDDMEKTFIHQTEKMAMAIGNNAVNKKTADIFLVRHPYDHTNAKERLDYYMNGLKRKAGEHQEDQDLAPQSFLMPVFELASQAKEKYKLDFSKEFEEAVLIGCQAGDEHIETQCVLVIDEYYRDDPAKRMNLYKTIAQNDKGQYGAYARMAALDKGVELAIDVPTLVNDGKTILFHTYNNHMKQVQEKSDKRHSDAEQLLQQHVLSRHEKLIVGDFSFRSHPEEVFCDNSEKNIAALPSDKRKELGELYNDIMQNGAIFHRTVCNDAFENGIELAQLDKSYRPEFEKTAIAYVQTNNWHHDFIKLVSYIKNSGETEEESLSKEVTLYKDLFAQDDFILHHDSYKSVVRHRLRDIAEENHTYQADIKTLLFHQLLKENNSNDYKRYALETLETMGFNLNDVECTQELRKHTGTQEEALFADFLINTYECDYEARQNNIALFATTKESVCDFHAADTRQTNTRVLHNIIK